MRLRNFVEDCWLFVSGFGLILLADLGICLYSGSMVYIGNELEEFRLGSIKIPKYFGATYLEVFIANIATGVALVVAFWLRCKYYDPERKLIKKYNLDERTGFWDDLSGDD